ncbi:bifunctional metallophosphatase/5'-nucleotidase [Amycolatopsis antarctica]|uniref:Bifunctional metallophosphatase/5'-nucleotidase n=1 Tax=Amycolatopsis antarctica TaxID=1854586 RepID=A0A263D7A6_9PSEU|nr:5'-nucleotidase C-terminal domain-containing protein [Amycolatopsis antarctica]OZM73366.1 bifunctional metallophosphatase/5'-nucleotidase [Amycolatopsis antarctica]
MRSYRLAGLAVTAAAALIVTSTPAATAAEHASITVMETSDLHGNVFNWDYYTNAEYDDSDANDVGLAKISSAVEGVRADRGRDRTMLIDNGDILQGTPLSYYYAKVEPVTETGETHPMAKAMNAIGYDSVTVGNHEFNYGLDLLDTFRKQIEAPVLGANVSDERTHLPAYQPFTLKKVDTGAGKPVTVGVLGLTTPGSAIWDKGNVEGKLGFGDMVQSAKFWVPIMKAFGAEVVVASSHAGDDGTSSYGDELPTENASAQIAEEVPGIDAVLFGHQHKDVPQRFVKNKLTGKDVLLTEPAKWGQRLSVVDFDLERKHGRWQVAGASSEAVNTNTVPEDPKITELLRPQHDKTVEYVNETVAESSQELSAAESRLKDTPIVDFIQKVQTDTVEAALEGTPQAELPVLSQASPFSRTAKFPAGPVTVRDIAGLYIYDNTLEAVTLTGAQVKEYLEFSAGYYNQLAPGAPVDPEALTNAGGLPDYNYDMLAGVDYDVDVAKPVGERIVNLSRDGVAVTPEQEFVLAVNNYRRSGGGNFPQVPAAPVVYNEQVEIRQALIDTATESGVIDPADFAVPNWKLVREGVPVF